MFKLMGKEINAILGAQTILIWTYDISYMINIKAPAKITKKGSMHLYIHEQGLCHSIWN